MKKIMTLLAVLLLTVGAISARDKFYNSTEPLPAAARNMLSTYFPSIQVNHVKVDKGIFSTEYEVILADGTEIDFDGDGEWEAIDRGRYTAIPDGLILKSIRDYVATNYKGAKIVEIDKDRNSYEISLSNGIDLEFDRAGNFRRIDD